MASNKRINKAYIRYDGTGRVIAGALLLNRFKPTGGGKWHEIPAYECCNPVPALPLRLTFDSIGAVSELIGGSVSDVSVWNTFFDLPANGTPFTSVTVVGNEVQLFGGSGITLKGSLFNGSEIVSIIDEAASIINGQNAVFASCLSLTIVDLPAILSIGGNFCAYTSSLTSFTTPLLQSASDFAFGDSALTSISFPSMAVVNDYVFEDAVALTSISLPICTNLGSTVGDDSVFAGIIGNTVSLTIPAALMTCNTGNPDGDIVYLQANNTVTVVTV